LIDVDGFTVSANCPLYDQICCNNNKNQPFSRVASEKTRQISELIRSLALVTAMTTLSLKGSKNDLEYLNAGKPDIIVENPKLKLNSKSSDKVHQGEVKTKVIERGEQNAAPRSKRTARYTKYPRSVYPKSFDEVINRLQTARENIIKNGYVAKYDDTELMDIVKSGEMINERYQVRLIFGDVDEVKDSTLGFRRDSGRAPYWTTTFEIIEAADSDPHLLAALSGITNYIPDQKFTLAIIDSHNLPISAER